MTFPFITIPELLTGWTFESEYNNIILFSESVYHLWLKKLMLVLLRNVQKQYETKTSSCSHSIRNKNLFSNGSFAFTLIHLPELCVHACMAPWSYQIILNRYLITNIPEFIFQLFHIMMMNIRKGTLKNAEVTISPLLYTCCSTWCFWR